jgi:hypothetical protein
VQAVGFLHAQSGVGFATRTVEEADTMSMREALVEAMHLPPDSETLTWLHDHGLAVADQDTMSQAIHDIYCGIEADHQHPNEKDQAQARALIAAIQQHATAETPA